MVAMPVDTALTTPVALTLATEALLLLQVPPVVASLRVLVDPTHSVVRPLMLPATTEGSTTMSAVAIDVPHAVVMLYDMMAVPADTAVTRPVVPTVAIDASLVPHTPPAMVSVNDRVAPAHMVVVPMISPGSGMVFTLTGRVATAVPQAPLTVYVMVAAPVAMPLTTPDASTVAIAVLLLLQVPPGIASVNVPTPPRHTKPLPRMLPASVALFTVMSLVALLLPQELVNV
jgi:hypothetical protein